MGLTCLSSGGYLKDRVVGKMIQGARGCAGTYIRLAMIPRYIRSDNHYGALNAMFANEERERVAA